ncbi:MAG: DsrE family protein [Pseudomonadota bacterium]
MRYSLLVLVSPEQSALAVHALRFSQALLMAEHRIDCVFFQDAGVLTGLSGCEAAQDELDLRDEWTHFAATDSGKLILCSASAARYGLLAEEGERLLSGFTIGGLGELVAAEARSDRTLVFGGRAR